MRKCNFCERPIDPRLIGLAYVRCLCGAVYKLLSTGENDEGNT